MHLESLCIAATLLIPSRGVNVACMCRTLGADQKEDSLVLNAAVKEAKVLTVGDFNFPRVDWAFERCAFVGSEQGFLQ